MKKYRIATIVGTRPELIRLSLLIQKLDNNFDHYLIHTGQNYDYELNEIFFQDLNIKKPDHYLNANTETLGDALGSIIEKSYKILNEVKPDAVLVLGDTNSSLSILPAKRLKIPIFHMEAGNRCFDFNVPEEINRKVADTLSDINLCYTENSRRYLLAEGHRGDRLYVTGSPMYEVLKFHKSGIEQSSILEKLDLKKSEYFVVSLHREENVDSKDSLCAFINAIELIGEKYDKEIIFSTHPRTRDRINKFNIEHSNRIKLLKPLGFFDYVNLQKNALCVLSDSGTISEESKILNFKAISLRNSTERPEALEAGSIILGGKTPSTILNALEITLNRMDRDQQTRPNEYFISNTSDIVLGIIQSWIEGINRLTWQKKY